MPVVYSATDLPEGLEINPTTGLITGVIAPHASPTQYYTSITATQSNDALTKIVYWNILPVGVNDTLALSSPGNQTSREGENVWISLNGSSALNPNHVFTFTGLPPGIEFNSGEGTSLYGNIGPRPAALYNVTVTLSNGFDTRQCRSNGRSSRSHCLATSTAAARSIKKTTRFGATTSAMWCHRSTTATPTATE